jgi:hypothetical protein
MHHASLVQSKGDEFSQEFSTLRNPVLNGNKEFSSEFSTMKGDDVSSSEFSTLHSPLVNGDNDFSPEFSTIGSYQNLSMVNGDNDFSPEFSTIGSYQNLSMVNGSSESSSEFSTIQTATENHGSHLLSNEEAEAKIIRQSLLTSKAYLNKTFTAKKDEREYVLNMQNLSAYLTGESQDDYSQFIDDNLMNFVNENADCRCYDLSINLECLKRKFMQHIRHLIGQKALKSSDTVNQASYPVAETR